MTRSKTCEECEAGEECIQPCGDHLWKRIEQLEQDLLSLALEIQKIGENFRAHAEKAQKESISPSLTTAKR